MRHIYILILAFTASVLSADEPDQTITVLKPVRPGPVVRTPMDFPSNHQPCNATCGSTAANMNAETDVFETRVNFLLEQHRAFTMIPPKVDQTKPIPWVWYAPTLGRGLPGKQEIWMFTKLQEHGIAVAGIDVGESYGSPQGRRLYQAFYQELTSNRRFASRPVSRVVQRSSRRRVPIQSAGFYGGVNLGQQFSIAGRINTPNPSVELPAFTLSVI